MYGFVRWGCIELCRVLNQCFAFFLSRARKEGRMFSAYVLFVYLKTVYIFLVLQLNRRKILFVLYLMRDPFFKKYTR